MQDSDRLGKQEIALLNRVADDFPYFQGVQVLLTKAYANQKHYEFEKQLHKTALLVPNREVLYRYIQGKEKLQQLTEPAIINPAIPEIISPPEVSAIEVSAPELKPEIEALVEEIKPEPISPDEEQLIQEISVVEFVPEAEISKPGFEPEVTESKNGIEAHTHEQHTFAEWLEFMQGSPKVKPALDGMEAKVEELPNVETPPVEDAIAQPAKVKPEEQPDDLKSNIPVFDTILDKFIRESPRISRPKAEFYNPANMAKQSVEEDEDLVTETLAKLYYKQGHYKKAIRAYEKLCLIYPHKMAYFADLIQKIKHENKD
jgi:tetratricopeptide (TPR) repeat protein